jgi:hypothetical protein
MKRRLLNLCTLLSLLLCAAVCGLWVRSHWVRDTLTWARESVVYTRPLGDHRVCSWTRMECAYGGLHVERVWLRTGVFAGLWPPAGFSHTSSYEVDGYPTIGDPLGRSTSIGSCYVLTWHGFEVVSADDRAGDSDPIYQLSHRSITFPLWLPALVAAAMTGYSYRRVRRTRLSARFRAPGVCRRCGYDLTGNVSGVCPECGADSRTSG